MVRQNLLIASLRCPSITELRCPWKAQVLRITFTWCIQCFVMPAVAAMRQCRVAAPAASPLRQRPSIALSGRPLQTGLASRSRQRHTARGSQPVLAVLDITTENFETEVAQVRATCHSCMSRSPYACDLRASMGCMSNDVHDVKTPCVQAELPVLMDFWAVS